jgi:restriction endonuclease S subunit
VPEGSHAWLASQSFVVLRLRRHSPISNPLVLFRFLSSAMGQSTIQSLKVGSVMAGLQMNDVRRLPILVPPSKAQAKIADEVQGLFQIQDHIQACRRELAQKQRTIWPEGEDG